MSTARFAVSVSVLTLFQYRVFRGFRITGTLLRRCEEPSHVDISQAYPHRAVDEPVHHRVGLDAAAEPAVPLRGRVLRTQHGRVRCVTSLDQLEQEADRDVVHVLGQPLVDHEELLCTGDFNREGDPGAGHENVLAAQMRGGAQSAKAWGAVSFGR